MKRVAIILANLEAPECRKYQLWPDRFQDNDVEIRCFSLNKASTQDEETCFDLQGKRWNLRRLRGFSIRHPREFLNFITQYRPLLGLKKALRTWSYFAPVYLWKPDIVHFVEPGLYPYLKPLPENTKTIVSFRGGDIMVSPFTDAKWRTYLTETLFPKLDCVHFISNAMLIAATKFAGKRDNYKMITMGVDLEKFKPIERLENKDRIQFVTTARLNWQKGLPYALEAVKLLRDQVVDLDYHIIGDGPMRTALKFQALKLGIDDVVNFHGRVDLNEVKAILANGDIYLQPSVTESLCVAAIEAMALKLPVVAFDVGGLAEVVNDGVSGLLSPVGDVQKLVSAIKKLIDDPVLRKSMGMEAYEIAKQRYSLEIERKRWLDFYRELSLRKNDN